MCVMSIIVSPSIYYSFHDSNLNGMFPVSRWYWNTNLKSTLSNSQIVHIHFKDQYFPYLLTYSVALSPQANCTD
jgi:hypothetical protein